jgi:hypothetical protein
MGSEIDVNDHSHQPATKQDIAEVRAEITRTNDDLRTEIKQLSDLLRAEIRETRDQLRSESHHGFDDLKETMRDSQTEMLKAFYGFAQSADARFKDVETADMALRNRLTAVEFRVTEIERRLNLPPTH